MSCTVLTCHCCCSFKEVVCRNKWFLLKDHYSIHIYITVTSLLDVIESCILPCVHSTLCILSFTCSFPHSQLHSKALRSEEDWFCCALTKISFCVCIRWVHLCFLQNYFISTVTIVFWNSLLSISCTQYAALSHFQQRWHQEDTDQ